MIYQVIESTNPNTIFKNNIFYIMEDGRIVVQKDCEEKDSSYYYEIPDIKGVIIKRSNGNYFVKACVEYINVDNHGLWFGKIRI